MARTRETCGCIHDGRRWIVECKDDREKNDALHRRALEDHRQNQKEFTCVSRLPLTSSPS